MSGMSDLPPPQEPIEPQVTVPPVQGYPRPQPQPTEDPLLAMVPYKNSKALIAYYLGLFSIFPLLGLIMGAAAIYLGREGLSFAKTNPEAKGVTHAKVGIGCGLVGLLLNLALIILFLAVFFEHAQRAAQPIGP